MIFLYVAIVACVVIALVAASKRNKDEIQETRYDPPTKIERNDFPENNADILGVVFTSKTCGSCEGVLAKARAAQSGKVDIINVDYEDEKGKKLHKKYQIEAVPTLVICDENGVVSHTYIGSMTATDLWASFAQARGDDIKTCGGQ